MEVSDQKRLTDLLNRLKSRDMSAFEDFYELTKHEVFYNILAIVKDYGWAEDILQETFVTFLENLDTLETDNNPLGYLFVISRNKSFKLLKRFKREQDFKPLENYEEFGTDDVKEDDYIFKKMKELLSSKEYRVVILHVINGWTHKEIAKSLKRPLGTITWTYANAIKKLQKGLCDYYGQISTGR